MEFATIMRRFGCEVTLVEYLDHILASADGELRDRYAKILAGQGITIQTEIRAVGHRAKGDALAVTLETVANGQRETLIVDRVLVAVGRTPQSENLGLEALREIIVGKHGGEQEQLMIDFGFFRTHQ